MAVPERRFANSPMLVAPERPWTGLTPRPDIETAEFFDGLRRHQLTLARCAESDCRTWIHPPVPACTVCHSLNIVHESAGDSGTVWTFSVSYREFTPGVPPPYVAALVELEAQPGLRILTNIVGCRVDDVRVGLRVHAVYTDYEEHTLVHFTPNGVRLTDAD